MNERKKFERNNVNTVFCNAFWCLYDVKKDIYTSDYLVHFRSLLASFDPVYYKRFRIVIYNCKGMLQFAAYLMIVIYAPS
jgi:hypothetical protein